MTPTNFNKSLARPLRLCRRQLVRLFRITQHYVVYAAAALDILDKYPNSSARGRLLNALELVSGKLVEDGQMAAAAEVLTSEANRFQNDAEAGAFRTRIVALIRARAAAYSETAPERSQTAAAAFRTAAQAILNDANQISSDADDLALLRGLANEAVAQAQLLDEAAKNLGLAATPGFLTQFQALATRILENQYRQTTTTVYDANGNPHVVTSRGVAFDDYKAKLDRFVNSAKALVGPGVDSVERAYNRLFNTQNVAGTTLTGAQIVTQFEGIPYQIGPLLTSFWQVSNAFNAGDETVFANSIGAISAALANAGLRDLAVPFSQQLIRNGATQHALDIAFRTHEAESWLQTRDSIRDFAVQFALVDLPIMVATSVLSAGTLSAAYTTWRAATGVRLSARVLMAAEFAVSIPIDQAIRRALGQEVDSSFLGTMKQAGFVAGSQLAGRILGSVGKQALSRLRPQLGGTVQTIAATNWRTHERQVSQLLASNNPGVTIGQQVSLDVTNLATGVTKRIRIDNIYRTQNGQYQLVDAKFSRRYNLANPGFDLTATVTRNQRDVYAWIATGQQVRVVPRGQQAFLGGLDPNQAISVLSNVQLFVNGPASIVLRQY